MMCVFSSWVSYRTASRSPCTLRLLGCCRTSMTCLRRSSLSLLLLYSSWLVSSVWCWVRISSARAFWIVPRCLNSSSCIDSWCLSSMACSRSFCVCRLFSSWKRVENAGWQESNKENQTLKWEGALCVTKYLSGQILLHIVSGNEDPAFEAPTLQLQVLPLSPQQVGLLLSLGIDTTLHYNDLL